MINLARMKNFAKKGKIPLENELFSIIFG